MEVSLAECVILIEQDVVDSVDDLGVFIVLFLYLRVIVLEEFAVLTRRNDVDTIGAAIFVLFVKER